MAAIKHFLAASREFGHCYLTQSQIRTQVKELIELDLGDRLPDLIKNVEQENLVTKPYTNRNQIMTYLCKKATVRYFRFHALRHFGASMLDAAGVPIGSIQRILGHENRTTTEIYLHSIGDS